MTVAITVLAGIAGIIGLFCIGTSIVNKLRSGKFSGIMIVGIACLAVPLLLVGFAVRSIQVQREIKIIEDSGDYYRAYQLYQECQIKYGDFGGVDVAIARVEKPAKYALATELFKDKQYLSALKLFLELGDYGNSQTCAENCMRAYLDSK